MPSTLQETWLVKGRKFVEAHVSLWVEKFYPYIIAIIAGWYARGNVPASGFASLIMAVAPTAISVSAVLAGFQATAPAILLAINDTRSVRALRKSRHYNRIIGYIGASIFCNFLFIVCMTYTLASQALTRKAPFEPDTMLGASVGLFMAALLTSWRVARLFTGLLKLVGKPEKGQGSSK